MKLVIAAVSILALSTGYSAVYNVNNGSLATSNGFAPTGLLSDIGAAAIPGPTTNAFQSPGSPGVVAIGIFSSLSDAQITGAVNTGLATLTGAFNIFGGTSTFSLAGPFGVKGAFVLGTSATVTDSIFSNKNIYLFVGNGATFGGSTELAVLKSNQLFLDAQDGIPTALDVVITTASTQLLFGRNMADVKTRTTDTSATPGWGTATAIPEPSAALLGALGALGLLRRRRI